MNLLLIPKAIYFLVSATSRIYASKFWYYKVSSFLGLLFRIFSPGYLKVKKISTRIIRQTITRVYLSIISREL